MELGLFAHCVHSVLEAQLWLACVRLPLVGVAQLDQHSAAAAASARTAAAEQLPEVQLHLEPAERPRQLRQHCYSDLMLKLT